ncbi:substrate-binding domain-containing protein [Burkholderia alba]|uniref:substrate-binding domain-containing protein n=1 Tax=Burkholderia alba TaxID=2683677 RepID=UPI002B0598EA|nr:substrate-binding domain-containing protein [Burkholderia alba]
MINSEIAVFPAANGTATYYSVGSGKGQTAFLNNDPTQFGAGVTGTVDFANSDAPLASSQITAYQGALGKTSGPLIQIPYIVTPIAIPLVNAPAGTGPVLPPPSGTGPSPAATVALIDDALCGIFSGKLTNWNSVINPDTGSAYALNAPIKVVYRADNSGTTDLLTAHLAQVCTTANTASGVTFAETQYFAGLFSRVPVNFVAATGSSGVAASPACHARR